MFGLLFLSWCFLFGCHLLLCLRLSLRLLGGHLRLNWLLDGSKGLLRLFLDWLGYLDGFIRTILFCDRP